MSRSNINRSGEMEVFVQVVEAGGFSHAARLCGMTQSAVSKLIARLEQRLGARLFNRSTRRLSLTAEGCSFYDRARAILADMDEAERQAGQGERPRGPVRLNTSASYATHVLAPVLPQFLDAHPEVTLDIGLTDAVIDLLAERTDVVVRAGPLRSSSLVARKLGDSRMLIVGAPAYLDRRGEPRTPADLAGHSRLGFGYAREIEGWPLSLPPRSDPSQASPGLPPVRVQVSDGEGIRQLALAGVGLGRLAEFTVAADIAAGRLRPVLGAWQVDDWEAFHAVHVGQGGPVPARVRVLLDFLARHGRVG